MEATLSQWPNLEDLRSGLVGVTQLPLPAPKADVPALIEIHGEYLCWMNPSTPEAVGQTEIQVLPSAKVDTEIMKRVPVYEDAYSRPDGELTGALHRFVRLRDAQDVLRFAQRYGVLDICEHGLPCTHNPRMLNIHLLGLVQSPSLWKPVEVGTENSRSFLIEERGKRPWCEGCGSEPVETWLFWSRQARAILNLAAALSAGRPCSREDWEVILTQDIDEKPQLIDTLMARRWAAGVYLQEAVNLWLDLANVRLALSWPTGAGLGSLRLERGGTFGLLGVQLLTAITGAQSLAICNGCSIPYIREKRRPQAGRQNYCLECRAKKVPERIRQQRKRDRDKQAKSAEQERQ
jgi:hypothetical protein